MAQQRLIWLPSAVHDLEQIVQYIRRDSKRYAASVARRIVATAKQVPSFPRAGRVVPEWDVETIRERIVYRYRLIYRITDADIRILGIIHGSRMLSEEVRDRAR